MKSSYNMGHVSFWNSATWLLILCRGLEYTHQQSRHWPNYTGVWRLPSRFIHYTICGSVVKIKDWYTRSACAWYRTPLQRKRVEFLITGIVLVVQKIHPCGMLEPAFPIFYIRCLPWMKRKCIANENRSQCSNVRILSCMVRMTDDVMCFCSRISV